MLYFKVISESNTSYMKVTCLARSQVAVCMQEQCGFASLIYTWYFRFQLLAEKFYWTKDSFVCLLNVLYILIYTYSSNIIFPHLRKEQVHNIKMEMGLGPVYHQPEALSRSFHQLEELLSGHIVHKAHGDGYYP